MAAPANPEPEIERSLKMLGIGDQLLTEVMSRNHRDHQDSPRTWRGENAASGKIRYCEHMWLLDQCPFGCGIRFDVAK
jgi:hypothetical protein